MTSDHILRKDKAGRVVVTRERRGALLAEFDKSGISGAQFAKWAGINYQTFAHWVQRRRKEGGQPMKPRGEPGPEVRWLEAVVAGQEPKTSAPPTADTPALIMYGPGRVWWRVESEDQARLAGRVLRHLGETC